MVRIAIFASGSGSNAEEIIKYFSNKKDKEISLVLSNKPDAFVLKRAKKFNVPSIVFNRKELLDGHVLKTLREHKIDYIVLAGFMMLIPQNLVDAFPDRIINIHPALLPKYGGKGMYGDNVHKAVRENKEPETGITVHVVNERYDEGQIIFQERCRLLPNDSVAEIAKKVHALEHANYPKVIDKFIDDQSNG
ncbi:MAG: phosphoribosylglycinamide formyltransferase [Fulvivirga sp.]